MKHTIVLSLILFVSAVGLAAAPTKKAASSKGSPCKVRGRPEKLYVGLGRSPDGAIEVGGKWYLLGLHKHPDDKNLLALLPHSGPPVLWLRAPVLPADAVTAPNGKVVKYGAKVMVGGSGTAWTSAGDSILAIAKGVARRGVYVAQWKFTPEEANYKDFKRTHVVGVAVKQAWSTGEIVSGPYASWNGTKLAVIWGEMISPGQSQTTVATFNPADGSVTQPVRIGSPNEGKSAGGRIAAWGDGFAAIWSAGFTKDYERLVFWTRLSNEGAAVGEPRALHWGEVGEAFAVCGDRLAVAVNLSGVLNVAFIDKDEKATGLVEIGRNIRFRRTPVLACVGSNLLVAWDQSIVKTKEGVVHLTTLKDDKPVDLVVARNRRGTVTGMDFNSLLVPTGDSFSIVWSQEHHPSRYETDYTAFSQGLSCAD